MRIPFAILGSLFAFSAVAAEPLKCGDRYPDTDGLFSGAELNQVLDAKPSTNVVISEAQNLPRFVAPKAEKPRPEPSQVEWVTVKRLILLGAVVEISQTHHRDLVVVTRTGRVLSTIEPELDDAFKVARVVDPCAVFIHMMTE